MGQERGCYNDCVTSGLPQTPDMAAASALFSSGPSRPRGPYKLLNNSARAPHASAGGVRPKRQAARMSTTRSGQRRVSIGNSVAASPRRSRLACPAMR